MKPGAGVLVRDEVSKVEKELFCHLSEYLSGKSCRPVALAELDQGLVASEAKLLAKVVALGFCVRDYLGSGTAAATSMVHAFEIADLDFEELMSDPELADLWMSISERITGIVYRQDSPFSDNLFKVKK